MSNFPLPASILYYGAAIALPGLFLIYRHWFTSKIITHAPTTEDEETKETKTIMSPPTADLPPPKDDPITLEELKKYDGTTPGFPIYVAIKGTIFDVSAKASMYGPGCSYNVFAGKDGSKGLGMSNLKAENAVSDWSTLSPADKGVLEDWYQFFAKRYAIMGKVSDLPPMAEDVSSSPAPPAANL